MGSERFMFYSPSPIAYNKSGLVNTKYSHETVCTETFVGGMLTTVCVDTKLIASLNAFAMLAKGLNVKTSKKKAFSLYSKKGLKQGLTFSKKMASMSKKDIARSMSKKGLAKQLAAGGSGSYISASSKKDLAKQALKGASGRDYQLSSGMNILGLDTGKNILGQDISHMRTGPVSMRDVSEKTGDSLFANGLSDVVARFVEEDRVVDDDYFLRLLAKRGDL